MSTLVVCVDRDGAVTAGAEGGPIAGWDDVRELVTEIGLTDPEDNRVNCLLEALRVTRELRDGEEEAVVAVVTGTGTASSARETNPRWPDDARRPAGSENPAPARREATADRPPRTAADREAALRANGASVGSEEPPPSSSRGTSVTVDRTIARQVDALIATYEPDAAVVVIGAVDDEQLVPIIESRVRVDAVDRVVVRQARDIESAYYLLKQFLADEELRQTVLVPIGAALLVFPVLMVLTDRPATAVAAIAAVIGSFFLYKGLGVDDALGAFTLKVREALYSGRVSIVTYAVAVGLAFIGVFAGAIAISSMSGGSDVVVPTMRFAFEGVPWFAAAALIASAGRLLDEALRSEGVRSPYLNLPFGVVAVGLVIRGFAAYFLERAGVIGSLAVPPVRVGAVSVREFTLAPGTRLAAFVIVAVLISLVGVRVAARVNADDPERLLE